MDWLEFSSFVISLLLTIGGCTVLNMLFDRDIDRKMTRTQHRPLASGQVDSSNAAILGTALVSVGLLWALLISPLYFLIDLTGAVLNVLVYTLWLKRRTSWSILWGGLAGGMPILAGHTLAVGRIDFLGLLLTLVIVLWIPSHNLTLSILYSEDFAIAGVPTILNVYGLDASRRLLVVSSLVTSILVAAAFFWLDHSGLPFWIELAACAGLVGMAVFAWGRPARPAITLLYKYSSIFMLGSMLLLALSGLG